MKKLCAAWLVSGQTIEDFESKMNQSTALHCHEEYLLKRAAITLPLPFICKCKSLMGESEFDMILSEIKNHIIEPGSPKIRSPDGLFISRACDSISRKNESKIDSPTKSNIRRAR